MKIFFGCSSAQIKKYYPNYSAIRNFLIEEGHILTRDWLPKAWTRYQTGDHSQIKPKEIFQAVKKALADAEALVIEDTVSNFSTGYEINYGLQRNIPVLVLWTGDKEHVFSNTFLHGMESEYLQISEYTLDNYKEIIKTFINKFSNASDRHRFNLVIDEVERKYLDWAKFVHKRSRTDIIRSLLRKQIDDDKEYQKYLSE